MTIGKDRIGALLLLVFSAAYWYFATDIRMLPFQRGSAFNAQTMPLALGALGVGLSLAIMIAPGSDARVSLRGYDWPRGIAMLALMIAYGLTLRPLGFILSTTLFLACGYAVLGERRLLVLVAASLPVAVGFWALMTLGLDIYVAPLPDMP